MAEKLDKLKKEKPNAQETEAQTPAGAENEVDEAFGLKDKKGEKTYTQSEVEGMIKERVARAKTGAKPADAAAKQPAPGGEAQAEEPQAEEAPTPAPQAEQPGQDADLLGTLAALEKRLAQAEVKAQLALAGIQPGKVERASLLVDAAACIGADGLPDAARIAQEVEEVLRIFPELAAGQAQGSAGFKIGAASPGKPQQAGADIDRAFGLWP